MKSSRGVFLLILLALALPGARKASGAGLNDSYGAPEGTSYLRGPLAATSIECITSNMPTGYDFQVVKDGSGAQNQPGTPLQTFLCNYTLQVKQPAGSNVLQASGLAITIDYNCPPATQSNWAAKTSPRSNEVARTANSLLTRETGTISGYAGTFSVQEKLFLLIDSHTIATIVVLTDPVSGKPDQMVFSANTAASIARDLASTYASQANDPVCGPPPGGASSTSGGGSQSTSGTVPSQPWDWDHINAGTAAAIAVGVGAVAALFGGLLTNAGAGNTTAAGARPGPPLVGSAALAAVPQAAPPAAPGPVVPAPANSTAPPAVANNPPSVLPPQLTEAALVAGATTAAAASADGKQGEQNKDKEEGGEQPCPEAQAHLFGLPDTNRREDCPGTRPSMGQWWSGIDFTSNNEHGKAESLVFEAFVSGEVTYVGGTYSFNMIEVKLENGNRIQYLHASEVYVKVGQHVGPLTKLGKTGGTGPGGPNQYEIHLHIQAIDKRGDMLDPDCVLAAGENRKLHMPGSPSPHRERIENERETEEASAAPEMEAEAGGSENADTGAAPSSPEAVAPEPEMAHSGPITAPLATAMASVPAPAITPEEPPKLVEVQETTPAPASPAVARVEAEEPVEAQEATPPPPPAQASPAANAGATGVRQVYCGHCGHPNPPTARFCGNCGSPMMRG